MRVTASKPEASRIIRILAIAGAAAAPALAFAQAPPAAQYGIYRGSTHAHTSFTWSHGEMLDESECAGVRTYVTQAQSADVPAEWSAPSGKREADCPRMYVIDGWQYHSPQMTLRSDWQQRQGPPSAHFERARSLGFDWYVTSDHSQEGAFLPDGPDNAMWGETKQAANAAIDDGFVALAGFEYSENDGPGGTGHINVINSAEIRNALVRGADLPTLYQWLADARSDDEAPVVASFNHPDPESFAGFGGRTEGATEIITMLEVVNSNSHLHEDGFIAALDAGWKVSPVSGLDNHGFATLPMLKSRTFVLARENTRKALLEAMRARRTYAALDENLECRYAVNGAVMGSTLERPNTFSFDILVRDPDIDDARDLITRIEIVKDGGAVVATHVPATPSAEVRWQPEIRDREAHYFFVRVWSAGGSDVPEIDGTQPVAWLAPVWTGVPVAASLGTAPSAGKSAGTAAS